MSERIVLSELDPDPRGAVAATRERVAVDQGLIDRLNDRYQNVYGRHGGAAARALRPSAVLLLPYSGGRRGAADVGAGPGMG